MKKLLLLFCALSLNSVNAQQTISFEASEGYSLGLIDGQNGWAGPFDTSDTSFMTVSDVLSSDGSNSLLFESDASQWNFYDGVLTPELTGLGSVFEISFDFYPDSDVDSDHVFYGIQTNGDELLISSLIVFNWQGLVRARVGATTSDVGTYTAEDWYNVKISYNFVNSTLTYFVNDVQVHTGATVGTTTGVNRFLFAYDNYGSGFKIDNIVITPEVASVNDFFAQNISIYPNPATDVFTLASSTSTIENITLTDLNGRAIKSINVDSLSSAEVNISDLTAGMYFVTVQTDNGSGSSKIIKK